jgi:sulfonate transport system ATP-binding protein
VEYRIQHSLKEMNKVMIDQAEHALLQAAQPPASGLGISVRDLVKRFGPREVLHDLNTDIRPGEFISIVGRSGCGKSTLLRLFAGLEEITNGSIVFDGDSRRHDRDDVRFMFQDARLLPWRTVIQNVALGLQGNKNEIRARAQEALSQVGLADRADDWPGKLSGGQRQRVALARALIHRPRLLLLDEPLGALDALTRIEMQRLIEGLWQQQGFTAILVTHDVSEAAALGDRILLVEEGRVTLDDQISLARPREHGQHEFAALESRVLKRLLTANSNNGRPQSPERIVEVEQIELRSEVRDETAGGVVTACVSSISSNEQPLDLGADRRTRFRANEVGLVPDSA